MIPIDLDYLERQCKLQGGNVEVPSHVLMELITAVRVLMEFDDHVVSEYVALDDSDSFAIHNMSTLVDDVRGKFSGNPGSYNF